MCAQGSVLRRLLASDNPAVRPDTIETFNPTALGKYRHAAVVRFAEEHGLAACRQQRRPHRLGDRRLLDHVPGPDARGLPPGPRSGLTEHHGGFHGSFDQLGVYGRQLRKYARGWQATIGGRVRRDGTGRDLGYPGGTLRPPRYDPSVGAEGDAT